MAEPICTCSHPARMHPPVNRAGDRPCQAHGAEECGCTEYTPARNNPRRPVDKERENIRKSAMELVHFLARSKSYQLTAFLNDLHDESELLGGPISMALDNFQDKMFIVLGAKMRREREEL